MARSLDKIPGTIAKVLNDNRTEIYDLIGANKMEDARAKVLDILDSPDIKDEAARAKAKDVFSKIHGNQFLSTLVTYMTGLKV